ncbi:MAG: lipase, partial [Actinoallomurus sp.]|nr:lipase [Actinoallomurus sp.]
MRRSLATILAVALAAVTALGIAGRAGSANAATRIPVVFVHGYGGNASNWTTAESIFEAGGYSSSQLFAYQYDTTQSNKTSAAELKSYITNVLVQTGASQVDIVNHSMGGLVSDWYIKELGGQPYVRH